MSGRTGAALIILLLSSAPGLAQENQRQSPDSRPYDTNQQGQQGTEAEQNACSADAVKFCSDDIPYTFRVLACLQKNRSHISSACRAVLVSHGQ